MKTKLLLICLTMALLACAITAPRLDPVTDAAFDYHTILTPYATPWVMQSDGRKATP